jgi:hypothetical protein
MRPNWRNGKSAKALQNSSDNSSEISQSTQLVPTQLVHQEKSKMPNPKESTSTLFFDICLEFATASHEVWPQDEKIKEYVDVLNENLSMKTEYGEYVAVAFHKEFQPLYTKVLNKDEQVLKHPMLESLKASAKFAGAPQSLKDTVWEYMKNMVQYGGMVDMYSKCPSNMLNSITGIASGMIEKLQNGEMDLSKLNPMQLGQMMMNDMKPEDLEMFGKTIMESGNIENMMSMMQSTIGSVPGMPSFSDLTSMMPMKFD